MTNVHQDMVFMEQMNVMQLWDVKTALNKVMSVSVMGIQMAHYVTPVKMDMTFMERTNVMQHLLV